MSAPRLSQADKKAILDAYAAGEPVNRIAERYGVHASYPTILAKRRGFSWLRRQLAAVQQRQENAIDKKSAPP